MPASAIELDRDLFWLVSTFYPAPLVRPLLEFSQEISKLDPNWEVALRRCNDCFYESVRFAALAATAECARRAGEDEAFRCHPAAEKAVREMRFNGEPGDGHFWELLREMLRLLQDGEGPLSVCARRFWKRKGSKETETELKKELDLACTLRNDFIHRRIDPANYKDTVATLREPLHGWFRALDFLRTCWLATPVDGDDGRVVVELRCGDSRRYALRCFDSTLRLERDQLYLIEEPDENAPLDERLVLPVHPFMILDAGQEKGSPADILLFQASEADGIRYGPGAQRGDLKADFIAKLAPLITSLGEFADMPVAAYKSVEQFAGRLKESSKDFLEDIKSQRLYRRDVQVARPRLKESVDEFLKSEKPVLIISGPSGIGKTCFLCKFAEEVMEVENCSTFVLLLAAKSLPTDFSLERKVCEVLSFEPQSIHQWWTRMQQAIPKKVPWRLVVVIDGIDKHPSIGNLFQAIEQWATRVRELPQLKLIVSYSPTGQDIVPVMNRELFFSSTQSSKVGVPDIQAPPFTEEERKEAYEKYGGPLTAYGKLRQSALGALSYPLFMRLVTEAYRGAEVPPNPVFQALQRYCQRLIFDDPGRTALVDKLVDTMMEKGVRELSGRELQGEPGLREAYLSKQSPLWELKEEQVLSVHSRLRSVFPVRVGEVYVDFSMDRVFQFLLILRTIEKYGGTMQSFLETGLSRTLEAARQYPSLRSALVDLFAEVARSTESSDADKRLAFSRLCAASGHEPGGWIVNLLSDVLLALAGEAVLDPDDEPEKVGDPFLLVVDVMLRELGNEATERFSATATDLFVRGLWAAEIVLLRREAESPDLTEEHRFEVQNYLFVALKNHDRWEDAREYSDRNEALLRGLAGSVSIPAQLQARHLLNRFSVYYDKGDRRYALDLCQRANGIAKEHRLLQEEAASANNLGIAYVYFDRPSEAESILDEGIDAGEDRRIAGHNYLNRALVRMVRWQLHGGQFLSQAEEDVEKASERFQAIDYRQGILYADATGALIQMYKALALKASFLGGDVGEWSASAEYKNCVKKLEEARGRMESCLERARDELKEDWPNYGIQTNLALLHLWQPTPNLEQALAFATGAYELVDGKKNQDGAPSDPEGRSVASLVLARVLLDCKARLDRRKDEPGSVSLSRECFQGLKRISRRIVLEGEADGKGADAPDESRNIGDADALLPAAVWKLLETAERAFIRLEFYSAAARAAAGLIEAAPFLGKDPLEVEERREEHRNRIGSGEFPPDFARTFQPMDWKLLFLAEL